MFKKLSNKYSAAVNIIRQLKNSHKHSGDLECVQNNTANIAKGDLILFATVKNEALLLEYFISYYESLGVDHFIFVDNGSEDGFMGLVAGSINVTVFYTRASYKAANFGVHWLNYLLRRYGSGHWCMTCDIDEYIVLPEQEYPNLTTLVEKLEARKQFSLFVLLVDMYAREHINSVEYKAGEDPLKANRFFDKKGYKSSIENHGALWVRGGVRARVAFDGEIDHSSVPALNKIPLIKWKPHYCYLSSMHHALPGCLNRSHQSDFTTVLLHFKFLTHFREKVENPSIRRDFQDEYLRYNRLLESDSLFTSSYSAEFVDFGTLFDTGLVKYNNQFNYDIFKR